MSEQETQERSAIGVDFGGTTIKLALVEDGRIERRGEAIDTLAAGSPEAIIDSVVAGIETLRTPETAAVGVGLPGFVDSVNGIVHELTNVPGWKDVRLRYLLRERLGLTVAIENDANAMAYAEWKHGAGRGHTNVICVTLGTGVGGGLILNNDLFRGSQLAAGEIGQMSIAADGLPGHYGNLGALEKYVGHRQLTERARRAYEAAGRATPEMDFSPLGVERMALAGDELAQSLYDAYGRDIGFALSNIVWLLNPDAIVIGGGVAKAGDLLFEPIRRALRERTSAVFTDNLQVVAATLGNDAGIIGAAAVALSLQKRL